MNRAKVARVPYATRVVVHAPHAAAQEAEPTPLGRLTGMDPKPEDFSPSWTMRRDAAFLCAKLCLAVIPFLTGNEEWHTLEYTGGAACGRVAVPSVHVLMAGVLTAAAAAEAVPLARGVSSYIGQGEAGVIAYRTAGAAVTNVGVAVVLSLDNGVRDSSLILCTASLVALAWACRAGPWAVAVAWHAILLRAALQAAADAQHAPRAGLIALAFVMACAGAATHRRVQEKRLSFFEGESRIAAETLAMHAAAAAIATHAYAKDTDTFGC